MTTVASEQTRAPVTTPVPLYMGVDIGRTAHYVAFISPSLLKIHKTPAKCPTKYVKNNRADIEALIDQIEAFVPLSSCCILVENTGHYGACLIHALQERGARLYRMHPKKRYSANLKTDKADAQFLALNLLQQIGMQIPVTEKALRVWPILPANPTIVMLRGLVQHRHELSRELVRRKNKLTAICDELFPEFEQIYKKDQNSKPALNLREKFPTPQDVAAASIDELCATCVGNFPGRKKLLQLQELARTSIGITNPHRRASLLIEQRFLIREKRQLEKDLEELDGIIEPLVTSSREGQILMSFAGVGPTNAATLMAGITNIGNFANYYHLRSYLGWSPKQSQSGTTFDRTSLAKSGNKHLKRTMYLIVMNAIKREPWKGIYLELCKRMATYNPKTKKWKGRMKAIGHICGRMIKLMFILLRRDDDVLRSTPKGKELPKPELYSAAKHMMRGGRKN